MLALIEHTPEIYIDEIQEQLLYLHNIKVSLPTITRTLKRLGYSSKKVCILLSSVLFYLILKSCLVLLQSAVKKHGVVLPLRLANILLNILSLQMRLRWTSSPHTIPTDGPSRVFMRANDVVLSAEPGMVFIYIFRFHWVIIQILVSPCYIYEWYRLQPCEGRLV